MPSKRSRQALDSSSQGSAVSSSTSIQGRPLSPFRRFVSYLSPAFKRQKTASFSNLYLDNIKSSAPTTTTPSILASTDDEPMSPVSGLLDVTPSKPLSEVTTSSLTTVNPHAPPFSASQQGAIRDPLRRRPSNSPPSHQTQPALLIDTRHSSEEAAEILTQDPSSSSSLPPAEPGNATDTAEHSHRAATGVDAKASETEATQSGAEDAESAPGTAPANQDELQPLEDVDDRIEQDSSAKVPKDGSENGSTSETLGKEGAEAGEATQFEAEEQPNTSTLEPSVKEKEIAPAAETRQDIDGHNDLVGADLPTDADVDHIERVARAEVGDHLNGPLDWPGAVSDETHPKDSTSTSGVGGPESAEDEQRRTSGALVVDLVSDSDAESDLERNDPDKENDVTLITQSPRPDSDASLSAFASSSRGAARPPESRFSFNGPLADQVSRQKQSQPTLKGLLATSSDASMATSSTAQDSTATEQIRSIGRQSYFVQPSRRHKSIAAPPQQLRPAGRDRSLSVSSVLSTTSVTGKRRSSGYRKRDPILTKQHQRDVAKYQASAIRLSIAEAFQKINLNRRLNRQPLLVREQFEGLAKKAQQVRKILDKENARETSAAILEEMMNRLMRQKQRDAQTAVLPLPPAKMAERERLKKEERAKLKKLRGVLGRKALPARMAEEQEAEASVALKKRGRIADIPGASVDAHDVQKLLPRQWLNDEVINFYGNLILQRANDADQKRKQAMDAAAKNGSVQATSTNGKVRGGELKPKRPYESSLDAFWRVHFFSSFFWESLKNKGHDGVKRWTRRIDIFSKDIVLFPINVGNAHWVCGAINLRRRRFEYYDSMGSPNPRAFELMRTYIAEEAKDKKKKEIDLRGWRDVFSDETPQQENGYDCGVFAAQTLEQISRRDPHYPIPLEAPAIVWKGEGLAEGASRIELGNGESGDDDDDDEYEWNFGQEDMSYLRRRMAYEIFAKRLLD